MPFLRVMESLTGRVTQRYRKAMPEPSLPQVGRTTEVIPSDDLDDLDAVLPLGQSGTWSFYEQATRLINTRRELYRDYDEMDAECPEFSSAMDIYADNATRGDSDGSEHLIIKSDDPRVSKILTDLRDRLGLDQMLWTLARDIAKYGERAEEVVVRELPDKTLEIARLKPLPTAYIIPKVDKYGRKQDPAYVQINDEGDAVAEFRDWQVIYFANKHSRSDLTGRGMGFSARRPFRQLRMMEDAIVIARLTRAHPKYAYMVDTTGLTPKDAQKHLDKLKAKLRKRRLMNPVTGKMDVGFNPLSIEEDIFVAVHSESKADVKVLQGDLTVGNLADLEYMQQKIFTGLKVPKTYLAHEKDTRTRAVVTEQDIQFARSVRRLQFILQDGFRKLFDLELALKGINPKSVNYTVALPVISVVDELRAWQTEQLKMLVAQQFKLTFWPTDEWILKTLLGYDDEEVASLIAGQQPEKAEIALLGMPKAGAAPANEKVSESWDRAINSLPEPVRERLAEMLDHLKALSDWRLESQKNAA